MTPPINRIAPGTKNRHTVGDLAERFPVTFSALGTQGDAAAGTGIDSVALDNRVVGARDLFVALRGAHIHGAAYIPAAITAGASAILTDVDGERELAAALTGTLAGTGAAASGTVDVPVLIAQDPRAVLGHLSAWVYGFPAQRMTTFAVTGTNGKTTTTYLLDHALVSLGWKNGLIGTVAIKAGDQVLDATLTTPEAPDLQSILAAMGESGVRTLTMEVSSHALALHRVDGLVFDVVGFTNLSQDHLDFHGGLREYFDTKAQLFTPQRARRGVVLIDDEWGARLAEQATIPVATVSLTGQDADWTVTGVHATPTGQTLTLQHTDGRSLSTTTALPGPFNVANAALALAMILEAGTDGRDLAEALDGAGGMSPVVPGRMEVIQPSGPGVVVDFAHNTDALALALQALRPITAGRLICVFGATGERDTGKRPAMGAVAAQGADVVIVTDDDPHGEDPAPIRAAVIAGARDAAGATARDVDIREVAPRHAAIHQAIAMAAPADMVLIAGRGHEQWQEVAGVDYALDDRAEARAALVAASRTPQTPPAAPASAPTTKEFSA